MRKDFDVSSMIESVNDLRNRISMDGEDFIYQEDYLVLDQVLDLLEYELELQEFMKNVKEFD